MRTATMAIHERAIKMVSLLKKAENNGLYVVESELCGIHYICDDECIAIATGSGYIKIKFKDAIALAEEMTAIAEDCIWRKEAQVEIPCRGRTFATL